ncbi:MAG: pirin family protein [Dysgonomonas sp.]|nr:pirin family protein [Dysgonomonas sp.]
MKTVMYRASTRGHMYHGWLDTHHTFSFASYYNPERMHFGALRVVNDDIVEGGEGFGKHPHDNMEIVSIPLYGDLEHKDSMGHTSVIHAGEIQVMSAGSGLYHSEYNSNPDKPLNFFQIWVFPNKQNVEPRYDQKKFDFLEKKNSLVQVVSPDAEDGSLWLHQDTWFHLGTFDKDAEAEYKLKKKGDGVFAMVIEGEFEIGNEKLHHRDGIGIWDIDSVQIKSLSENGRILLIEVPMEF